MVVDGTAYRVLGDAPITNTTVANQSTVEFTATRTSFILTAGKMDVNVSFISPVEVRTTLVPVFDLGVGSDDG